MEPGFYWARLKTIRIGEQPGEWRVEEIKAPREGEVQRISVLHEWGPRIDPPDAPAARPVPELPEGPLGWKVRARELPALLRERLDGADKMSRCKNLRVNRGDIEVIIAALLARYNAEPPADSRVSEAASEAKRWRAHHDEQKRRKQYATSLLSAASARMNEALVLLRKRRAEFWNGGRAQEVVDEVIAALEGKAPHD